MNSPPTVFLRPGEPFDFTYYLSTFYSGKWYSGGTALLELHLFIRASWEHKLFPASSCKIHRFQCGSSWLLIQCAALFTSLLA